jgi:hypothetical protein
MTDAGPLPHIDEHRVRVAAPRAVVWGKLGASLRGQARRAGPTARLLGATPDRRAGDPLDQGSTIPGFAVVESVPHERLVLAGRHRFSVYRLAFSLVDRDGATELAARSDGRFPGVHGAFYRALVIGSGGHRLVTRRWLRRIAAAAETDAG